MSIQDLNDPNRDPPDVKKGDREFKKLIQKLVHNLTIRHVQPEEIIIMQSETIIDPDGIFDEEKAFFYIILNGSFKVATLKFNQKKKTKDNLKMMQSRSQVEMIRSEIDTQRPKSKKLISGDFFGEVSFIYNCRRTCTIKARLYATLGCIDAPTTMDLLQEFPDFKSHMKHDIVNVYDDDLKLFLLETLQKVDYLQNVSKEILTNIAYVCNAEIKEKGSMLFNYDEDYED